MLVIGLTGGIGSGKSTVAELLERRGAVVVDADRISREVVEPGTEGFEEVVNAFGEEVVGPDGALDRQRLADIVFRDPERRKALESIIWPRVGLRISERVRELEDTDEIVVLDIPLLSENRRGSGRLAEAVLVVEAAEEERLNRLEARGVPREDAKARMTAQSSPEDRRKIADHLITNDGSVSELEAKVDEVWRELCRRAGRDV